MLVVVGCDGSGNDDESIWSHDSDNYSGTSEGEHSSDDDGQKYASSPADYKHDKSAHYADKHLSSLENSEDVSHGSDDSVNENNGDCEDRIDDSKPAASKVASSRKTLPTKRR